MVGNTCSQLAFTLGLARTTATNSALILSTVPTVVAVFAGALGLERIAPDALGHRAGNSGSRSGDRDARRKFDRAQLGDLLTWCWRCSSGPDTPSAFVGCDPGVEPASGHHHHHIAGTPGLVSAGIPGMLRVHWDGVSRRPGWPGVRRGPIAGGGVPAVEPKREGGRRNPDRRLYVSDATGGRAGAWLLLGERPHPLQGVGAVFIIAGVLLTRARVMEKQEGSVSLVLLLTLFSSTISLYDSGFHFGRSGALPIVLSQVEQQLEDSSTPSRC